MREARISLRKASDTSLGGHLPWVHGRLPTDAPRGKTAQIPHAGNPRLLNPPAAGAKQVSVPDHDPRLHALCALALVEASWLVRRRSAAGRRQDPGGAVCAASIGQGSAFSLAQSKSPAVRLGSCELGPGGRIPFHLLGQFVPALPFADPRTRLPAKGLGRVLDHFVQPCCALLKPRQ